MIHRQGAKYKGEPPAEITEQETQTGPVDTKEPTHKEWKLPVPLPVLVVAAVAILIVAILLITWVGKSVPAADRDDTDDTFVDAGEFEWGDFTPVASTPDFYTEEDRELLRAWGYTGTEIETHEELCTPVDQLVEESRKAQEAALSALSDPMSPEYKQLLDFTWLGQSPITLPEDTEGVAAQIVYTNNTYIADYEKVPAMGHSLYLKIYLEDGSAVFMECPLARYIELPDSGNIVVKYSVAKLGDITIIQNITEVRV